MDLHPKYLRFESTTPHGETWSHKFTQRELACLLRITHLANKATQSLSFCRSLVLRMRCGTERAIVLGNHSPHYHSETTFPFMNYYNIPHAQFSFSRTDWVADENRTSQGKHPYWRRLRKHWQGIGYSVCPSLPLFELSWHAHAITGWRDARQTGANDTQWTQFARQSAFTCTSRINRLDDTIFSMIAQKTCHVSSATPLYLAHDKNKFLNILQLTVRLCRPKRGTTSSTL